MEKQDKKLIKVNGITMPEENINEYVNLLMRLIISEKYAP